MTLFKSHNKHVLILEDSGKPVFSRYRDVIDGGGEDFTTCAFLRGLIGKVEVSSTLEEIREFSCEKGLKVVFMKRDPGRLHFICIARTGESAAYLRKQLHLLHMHVLMHTTRPGLERLFVSNPSYDLTGLLAGTEAETKNLIRLANGDFGILTDSVTTVAMPREARKLVHEALREAAGTEALFGIVFTGTGKFVCGVSNLSSTAPPQALDLALLLNFTLTARSQLANEGETWTPLCLPEFNDSGHTHAYCTYLSPSPPSASATPNAETELCLLLLFTDANLDLFHLASKRKEAFASKVIKGAFNEQGVLLESAHGAVPWACDEAEGALLHLVATHSRAGFCKRQSFETAIVGGGMEEHGRDGEQTERRGRRRRRKALVRSYSTAISGEGGVPLVVFRETGEECIIRVAFPQHDLEILASFSPHSPHAHCSAVANRARGWILDHKNDLFFFGGAEGKERGR